MRVAIALLITAGIVFSDLYPQRSSDDFNAFNATDIATLARSHEAGEQTNEATAISVAFGLPRILALNTYMSRSFVVEAVYQATALSGGAYMGRVVNTGTLTQGYGGFQYSPQPTDRLVVNMGQQQVHEFVVHQAQGNNQAATASAWVMAPHILRYTHRLQGQAEGEISAQFDGARFQVQVRGWYVQSGVRYDVNLTASGATSGSSGYHGQDSQTQYGVSGTISGGGVAITVNEQHSSSMAAATSLYSLPSQRGSASRFNATINNVVRVGGADYQFQNVQVQVDQRTRGTGPAEGGLTGLSGVVLRSGQPFGQMVLQAGRAFLQTQSGMLPLDLNE